MDFQDSLKRFPFEILSLSFNIVSIQSRDADSLKQRRQPAAMASGAENPRYESPQTLKTRNAASDLTKLVIVIFKR